VQNLSACPYSLIERHNSGDPARNYELTRKIAALIQIQVCNGRVELGTRE
jgi:hypothetical protein